MTNYNFSTSDNIYDWSVSLGCTDLKYYQLRRQDKVRICYELTPEQEAEAKAYQFKGLPHVSQIMSDYH